MEKVAVTPDNLYDGNPGEEALPDDPGGTLQMKSFRVPKYPEERLRIEERMAAYNRHDHRIRASIEKMFGAGVPKACGACAGGVLLGPVCRRT